MEEQVLTFSANTCQHLSTRSLNKRGPINSVRRLGTGTCRYALARDLLQLPIIWSISEEGTFKEKCGRSQSLRIVFPRTPCKVCAIEVLQGNSFLPLETLSSPDFQATSIAMTWIFKNIPICWDKKLACWNIRPSLPAPIARLFPFSQPRNFKSFGIAGRYSYFSMHLFGRILRHESWGLEVSAMQVLTQWNHERAVSIFFPPTRDSVDFGNVFSWSVEFCPGRRQCGGCLRYSKWGNSQTRAGAVEASIDSRTPPSSFSGRFHKDAKQQAC